MFGSGFVMDKYVSFLVCNHYEENGGLILLLYVL